jgi:hypothetical protein
MSDTRPIRIHKDVKKVKNGETFYRAEVSDEGGTHGFWISEKNASKYKNKSYV